MGFARGTVRKYYKEKRISKGNILLISYYFKISTARYAYLLQKFFYSRMKIKLSKKKKDIYYADRRQPCI